MKNIFRILLVLSLISSNLLTTLAKEALPSAGYNDPLLQDYSNYQNPFSDTYILMQEGKAAAELYRRKITSGYPDGEFKGHREINRAEAIKFLLQARYDQIPTATTSETLADVNDSHWFKNYVMLAKEKGIIAGYNDNTFRAANSINTAEFLKMLAKTFELPDNLPHSYIDVDPQGWYAPLAGIASVYKLFPERNDKLESGRNLTRTEVAIAIYNYFKYRNTDISVADNKDKYKNVEALPYASNKLGLTSAKILIDTVGNLSTDSTKTLIKNLIKLQAAYPNDVRVSWNYYPTSIYDFKEYEVGNSAECAADQEKFWEYLAKIAEQNNSAYGKALYLNIATSLELNMKKFEICLEEETYIGHVQHDKDQAKKDNIAVLPTMFINGKTYGGITSYSEIEKIITDILNTPETQEIQ